MHRTEREFVSGLERKAREQLPRQNGALRLRQGIGDDCAVLSVSAATDVLITTDLFLENVHFRLAWQPPDSVGHKVLARGLSDIAAMGGVPRHAFLSLAVPKALPSAWIDEFFRGFFRLARKHGVALAGGDTAAARNSIVADIVVIGEVPRGKALLRSGARAGDELWVTGRLGGAAHGLALSRRGLKGGRRESSLRRIFYPEPRLSVGAALRERGYASAMMDISDGLSIDLARLCEKSRVGARIYADAIPKEKAATLEESLHGGEDFELLFTAPPQFSERLKRVGGKVRMSRIGEITSGRQLMLVKVGRESELPVRGFQHF